MTNEQRLFLWLYVGDKNKRVVGGIAYLTKKDARIARKSARAKSSVR